MGSHSPGDVTPAPGAVYMHTAHGCLGAQATSADPPRPLREAEEGGGECSGPCLLAGLARWPVWGSASLPGAQASMEEP